MPSAYDNGAQVIGDAQTTEDVLPYIDRWFYNDSGSTIPANKAVSFDLTKTPRWTRIRESTAVLATDASLICGVSVNAIPTGTWGKVRVRGEILCETGTVTAGMVLQATTNAGRLAEQSATFAVTHRQVAIAAEADGGDNLALVYVLANAFV